MNLGEASSSALDLALRYEPTIEERGRDGLGSDERGSGTDEPGPKYVS
jgi:hypothetical protein